MATTRPAAVVISASEMPPASTAGSATPANDGHGPGRGIGNAYGVGAGHGGRATLRSTALTVQEMAVSDLLARSNGELPASEALRQLQALPIAALFFAALTIGAQTMHVVYGLPDAWSGRSAFTVGELGFGTGLNIVTLLDLWRRTLEAVASDDHGAEADEYQQAAFPRLRDPDVLPGRG